jgi:hypothetical protein
MRGHTSFCVTPGKTARLVGMVTGRSAPWTAAMCLLAALGVHAHTMGRVESAVLVDDAHVRIRLFLDLLEIVDVDTNHDGEASLAELDQSIERVNALVRDHLRVDADSAPVRTTLEHYAVRDGHVGELDFVFDFASPPNRLTIRSTLDRALPASPEHVVSVSFGGGQPAATTLLDGGNPEATFVRRSRRWYEPSRREVIEAAAALVILCVLAATAVQLGVRRS